jgi:hypothetical protein
MEKHIDKLDWNNICCCQKLSKEFMEKHVDKLDWNNICCCQKLSKEFMEKHADKLNWTNICQFQKLSEEFMVKHADKLDCPIVCQYQKLSEEFMEKHADKLDWHIITYIYKLTNPIFDKYIKKENNWLYLEEKEKIKIIKKMYTIIEKEGIKYVECYKSVRENYSSIYNPNSFTYDKLNYKYETICNYNTTIENSYGFGCWTVDNAIGFAKNHGLHSHKIIKCLVPLDCVCMLQNGKIRSSVLIVTEFL